VGRQPRARRLVVGLGGGRRRRPGTQGKGSLTRPASYCGVYGFKPGHGTIHRGGDGGAQATNTHIGTLAGSLEDAWATARFLTVTAGPHPGHFSFAGPAALPEAQKPARLVRLEGSGWDETADAIKAAYEALLEAIETAGVVIESADDTPASRAVAAGLEDAENALMIIADWESVWPYVMHLERDRAAGGNGYDPVTVERGFARADVRREDYEDALRFRIAFREKLAACQMDNAYFISPAATDLAPLLAGGTGSAAYQWASSLAGNPVVALPLMAADGLPAGLQLQGFEGQESALAAACTWLDQAFKRGEI
jgi:Asp-tRNA(Asn)/Glu-tRNA(Gln) amidotransferase A subunit family amidase